PDPTPPRPRVGSLEYDLNSSTYNSKWDSWPDFEAWLAQEQREKGIDYADVHNHPLGNDNLPFTQISHETREYIAGLLRLKVSPNHILKLVHGDVYNDDNTFEDDDDNGVVASRNDFIQLKDIRRIEKAIEAESVRLHPDDGQS
ncbi:hypothetical protein B0H19DRAFT_884853, partial [Mycena capillaripes]